MFWRSFHLLILLFMIGRIHCEEKCEKIGPQCSPDGKEVWFCAEKDKAPIDKEICQNGKKCRDENGQVACMDSSSAKLRFKCTAEGEFPDPNDCSRTYICTEGNDKPAEVCYCPGSSYVYPEQGLFCFPDECPRKDITCSEGVHGYFELHSGTKTSYYYYCSGADVVEVYEGVAVPDSKSLRREFLLSMKNGKECEPFENSTLTTVPPQGNVTSEPSPKPTEPTTKPTDPTTKPTEPTTKPTEPTTKPTEPTTKPTEPTTKPTEPTTKPTEPTAKPTEPTTKPTDPTAKPTDPTAKPPEEKPKCGAAEERYKTECECDFYECDKNLVPQRRICRKGMFYSPKFKKCIYGDCDETKCIHRPK